MESELELPAKNKPTDYSLCIKCQEYNKKERLTTPRDVESYDTFLANVNKRSEWGSHDFINVGNRLIGITASDLLQKGAKWHRSCYSETTDKNKAKRDEIKYLNNPEKRKGKGRPTLSVESSSVLLRSATERFDREKCFFCQGQNTEKDNEILYACRSENSGISVKEIVDKSDNASWKVQLADIISEGDFLARDIVYHKSCKTTYWRIYVQGPERRTETNQNSEETIFFIAAEMEFYDELHERIESGDYITTVQAEELYYNMMRDHGVTGHAISRRTLITNITHNLPDIELSQHRGKLPGVFHSKKSGREAVDIAISEQDIKGDLNIIFKCAKIIRKEITKARKEKPWVFTGSLDGVGESGLPVEVLMLNRWILQGSKAATTESRDQSLRKSCVTISQMMMQEFKTSKQVAYTTKSQSELSTFRRQCESPYAVGLSLWIYHNLRSQTAINLLSHLCCGISYSRVTRVCSQIANAVQENINKNGIFVPVGIVKGRAIRASADNVDKKVDTFDGKSSFHAMAACVYQPICAGETLVEPLDLYEVSAGGLLGVPSTCIKILKCDLEGSPKPQFSPHYASYKVGSYDEHFDRAIKHDMCWMMARYFNRSQTVDLNSSDVEPKTVASDEVTIPAFDVTNILSDNVQGMLSVTDISNMPAVREEHECLLSSGEISVQMSPQVVDDERTTQMIPVWAAYNSLSNTPESTNHSSLIVDKAFTLPIINAPAHEWSTLVTTLDQLCRLNRLVSGNGRKLVVTFDMDLYKRVLKLEYLDSRFKDQFVVCPGAFHTSLCALRCLGKAIEGSGIDEAWVEAGLYSSVTVNQIINGNHYNRAMEAHEVTLQVLFDLWIGEFFAERPAVRVALEESIKILSDACTSKQSIRESHKGLLITLESLNIEKQLADFDAEHNTEPIFKWARMYMKQVLTLLQFQRATRLGDWFLHLSSLEKLCVYFFAYGRHDYAQNIPEYIARMCRLQTTDPEIWQDFMAHEFTVNTSNQIPFTRIGIDHAQEHVNKNLKGQGAIGGITQSPATLLKFCMCAPELARIANETEAMADLKKQSKMDHHELNKSTTLRQEQAIKKLFDVLAPCGIFKSGNTAMVKLVTNEIVPKAVEESILSCELVGKSAMQKFVDERICGNTNLWDKMTKCKSFTWTSTTKEVKVQAKSDVLTLQATSGLMSRLLVVARSSREIDMEEVIGNYEFTTVNRTLMRPDGSVHPTLNKGSLITVLENLPVSPMEDCQDNLISDGAYGSTDAQLCLIVDGMAVVQELMAVKSFENGKALGKAYVELIDIKSRNYNSVRVIFDNYAVVGSLKESTRERRRGGKAQPKDYNVEDNTKIPELKVFLGSVATKDSLTLYLAQRLIDHSKMCMITATRKEVMSNYTNNATPGVSTQEEADTLMILHAVEANKAGYTVHIYSQDADVLILALRRTALLGKKSALVMGTGDRRRLVLLQPIYDALGPERANALCKWHALTGCDTTGYIRGKSKKACLEAFLKADTKIVTLISGLGCDTQPSNDTLNGCISFLCSLFCKKNVHITEPHHLRWHLFKQQGMNKGVDMLPPTRGTWVEHIQRAHCQASVWEQDLVVSPLSPDPLQHGWVKEEHRLVPLLSKVAPAPAAVVELVRCTCGTTNPSSTNKCASGRCSCRLKGLVCTELCRCEGEEDHCQNLSSYVDPDDAN